MLTHDPAGPVLIAGGYGVVGSALAELLHVHHGELPLLLAGRDPQRGGSAVAARTGAGLVRWDLGGEAPDVAVRAVVTTVNDPGDRALRAAVGAGVPYVDVTRWTARLHAALAVVAAATPTAPVVMSSGWMGGLVPRLVGHHSPAVGGATGVDVAVRYDVADRAGVDSVDFMDRLDIAFPAAGKRLVTPLTEVRTVDIGGDRVKVGRIDTPEQFTLPLTLGLRHSATRIGFSAPSATATLLALRRVGFFRLSKGDRLRGLRRSMLFRPGAGGEARLRIDLHGRTGDRTVTVSDPLGQAHLTAVGALLSLRDALAAGTRAGVVFPEMLARPELPAQLAELGVTETQA